MLFWAALSQLKWIHIIESERSVVVQRARLFVVGEGGAGKTTLIRALRDLPFEDTSSTAGIDTSTLETTDMQDWVEMNGTEHEKVMPCIQKSSSDFDWRVTHPSLHVCICSP